MDKCYQRRKEQGLCVRCGNELEEHRKGKCHCQACADVVNESKRLDRLAYIKVGICPKCKTNRLVGDEKLCYECGVIESERKAKYREKWKTIDPVGYRKKQNESAKRTQERWLSEGRCIKCGKPKYGDTKFCEKCKIKYKQKWAEKRGVICDKELRAELGLCVNCAKPAYEGHKLCKDCYEKSLISLSKALESRKAKKLQKDAERRTKNEQSREKKASKEQCEG